MSRPVLLLVATVLLTPAYLEEVPLEMIVASTPCSATCGLGLKKQTLCLVNDSEAAMEEGNEATNEELDRCRERTVKCLESWQCGLTTMTVMEGQRVELDCLGEVMKAIGRFSWRVSWRYARGIITSDDLLFSRWKAPLLDRVILDPVEEANAGTYRCVVQDTTLHSVKQVYWGIRILSPGFLNLDYENSLAQWDVDEKQKTRRMSDRRGFGISLVYIVLISLCLAVLTTTLVAFGLHLMVAWKNRQYKPFDPDDRWDGLRQIVYFCLSRAPFSLLFQRRNGDDRWITVPLDGSVGSYGHSYSSTYSF